MIITALTISRRSKAQIHPIKNCIALVYLIRDEPCRVNRNKQGIPMNVMDKGASESISLISLLRQGLDAIWEGHEAEGLTFIASARKKLPPGTGLLADTLDLFIERHAAYTNVEQALREASLRFAEAYAQLQAGAGDLKAALSALMQEAESAFPDVAGNKEGAIFSPMARPALAFPERTQLPDLFINCLGRFEVRRGGIPVPPCSNRNGQAILRYFSVQTSHSATADVLQALFWPEDEQEVAQRKLHIAISALRRSLNDGQIAHPDDSYITCKNRAYFLNPAVVIHTDVDDFLRYYQAGRQNSSQRIACFKQACCLYIGPFLPEDMYADWSFIQREQLSQVYLTMCHVLADHYLHTACYEDAAYWSTAILKENRCDEFAHRSLIQVYAALGRRSEALQQYQRCKCILYEELQVQPLHETTLLYQSLLSQERVGEI